MTDRRTSPWIAFAAGAVAMLVVALLAFVWLGRGEVGDMAKTAAAAAKVVPDLEPPPLPDAPRIPDVPVPRPK